MNPMNSTRHANFSRRDWLKLSAAGVAGISGISVSGWLGALAQAAGIKERVRSCILLWMSGGPSQMDTFDLKPGHANGGPVKEIETAVAGIRISENLPRLAPRVEDMTIIPSIGTREGEQYLRVQNLDRAGAVSVEQFDARLNLLDGLDDEFRAERPDVAPRSHQTAYQQAVRMMKGRARKAFNLEDETSQLRDSYGRNAF